MMKFLPLALVTAAVLVVGTYVHGIATDRWTPQSSEQLDRFTEQIPKIPLKIGEWVGTEETISDKEFALTNCTAYISRRYVNREGKMISMYLVSGTARHITIHSPDWCYQGAGFKMQSEPVQFRIDCGPEIPPAEFLTSVFRKENPMNPAQAAILRIFWTYSSNGKWQGPEWAKVFFAGKPALFKIYLICDESGQETNGPEESIAVPFAKTAFPVINRILFNHSDGGEPPDAATAKPLSEDLILD